MPGELFSPNVVLDEMVFNAAAFFTYPNQGFVAPHKERNDGDDVLAISVKKNLWHLIQKL